MIKKIRNHLDSWAAKMVYKHFGEYVVTLKIDNETKVSLPLLSLIEYGINGAWDDNWQLSVRKPEGK